AICAGFRPRPSLSTLLPYTTLFRSSSDFTRRGKQIGGRCAAGATQDRSGQQPYRRAKTNVISWIIRDPGCGSIGIERTTARGNCGPGRGRPSGNQIGFGAAHRGFAIKGTVEENPGRRD